MFKDFLTRTRINANNHPLGLIKKNWKIEPYVARSQCPECYKTQHSQYIARKKSDE